VCSSDLVLLAFLMPSASASRTLFFMLAIATRQYMVTFPMALVAHELWQAFRERRRPRYLIPDSAAALSLVVWIYLFGGLGPDTGLQAWPRHAGALGVMDPMLGLYTLTTVAVYFVVPETLLFRSFVWLRQLWTRRSAVIALGLLALFLFDPPIFSALKQGPVGRIGDLVPVPLRMAVFYALAWLTCVRFSGMGLATWLILTHILLILNTWSAWEKYLLPMLVVLWFLKARGELDRELDSGLEEAPGGVATASSGGA
jgi:hypothetical protein